MERLVKSLSFAIGAALLVSFCGTSAMAGLLNFNKVKKSKVKVRTKRNGRTVYTYRTKYKANFKIKDGTTDLRLPFNFEGTAGRYLLKATWKPTTKIDVKLMVPAGGVALLNKRLGNRPGEKYFELKDRNFSNTNKGMKAAFSIKNNTGVTVLGSVSLIYAPRSEEEERSHALEERQNVQAERQRESNNYLKKRVETLERAVQSLTARVRALELKRSTTTKPARIRQIK